jgi:quinol monooxygenase YgiN
MPYVTARHKVSDYQTWKKAFDKFASTRKAGGEISYKIWRDAEDPNDLSLLFEWDTIENANKFMNSPELQTAMKEGGVTEKPRIQFLTTLDEGKL